MPSTPPRRRAGIAIAIAIGALAVPSPASAYLRSVTQTNAPTGTPLSNPISLNRTGCNFGQQAIGGNAFITTPALFATGGPALAQAGIDVGGNRFVADGRETDPFSGRWRTGVSVRCATNTSDRPKAGSAASFVKAVQVVEAVSASGSSTSRLATAVCPAGKTAITGGASVGPSQSGFIENLAVTRSAGASLGGSWQAGAREVDPTSVAWRVRAFAICANTSTETKTSDYTGPDVRVVETTTLPGSRSNLIRAVFCPTGMFVVGGGARAIAVLGEPANVNIALVTSQPTGNSAGWTVHAQETDSTSASWRLVVQAVCTRLDTSLAT
jgi:hypothetical protein